MADVPERDLAQRLLRSAEQAVAIRQGIAQAARVARHERGEQVVVREPRDEVRRRPRGEVF